MGTALKERRYEELARICKARCRPKRLELLEVLARGGRSVEALRRLVDGFPDGRAAGFPVEAGELS